MKDILQDLLNHTHSLGCIDLIKIKGTDTETVISGLASDRSVVITGKMHEVEPEFKGTFGMPSMSVLKTILGISEYDDNSKITVKSGKNGPEQMTFESENKDFKVNYRFMVQSIVDDLLKPVKFKGANWNVEFEPSVAGISKLKSMSTVNNDVTCQMTVKDGDLIISFGDHSTHSGDFTFKTDVEGVLTKDWHWPIGHLISILSLAGDKTMRISDDGATEITVDSGLAEYKYILPAQTK